MAKIKPTLSVIIVNYGSFLILRRLILSVYNSRIKSKFEIIVVDNNPDNEVKKELKKLKTEIRYVKSPGNIGYAKGNNLGAKYAQGKYLLIINPDTLVKRGTIDNLINFLNKNPSAAIAGPSFLYPNGEVIDYKGSKILTPLHAIFVLSIFNKIWPGNPVSKDYLLKNIDQKVPTEVGVVSGTAFLIRKDVFVKVGGFDINFFLFFEEADICKRVKEVGYKIYVVPKAVIVHDWEPAEGGKELNKHYRKSRFYYFNKHYGLASAILVSFFTSISKRHLIIFLMLLLIAILYFV